MRFNRFVYNTAWNVLIFVILELGYADDDRFIIDTNVSN